MASSTIYYKLVATSVPTPPTGYQTLYINTSNELYMKDDTGADVPLGALTNPMTTPGDIIVGGTNGTPTRLGIGANGYTLTVSGGVLTWVNNTALTNPMTTSGDLIYGGASGIPERLGVGTNGYVLTLVAGAPAWAVPSTSGLAVLASANVFTKTQTVSWTKNATATGAITLDVSTSNNFKLTLTGNVSGITISNPTDGQVLNIEFVQDATGSRTVVLPTAFKFAGGVAPTFSTAANAVDFLSAIYDGDGSRWLCSFVKGLA